MLRLLYPLIFTMAIIPDSDKYLENLQSVAQATQITVKNMKDGMDGFHSNIMSFYQILNEQGKGRQGSA